MGPRAEQQNYINFYKLIRQTIIRNVNSIKATNILCIIWVNKNFYNNLIKKLMHNLFFLGIFWQFRIIKNYQKSGPWLVFDESKSLSTIFQALYLRTFLRAAKFGRATWAYSFVILNIFLFFIFFCSDWNFHKLDFFLLHNWTFHH